MSPEQVWGIVLSSLVTWGVSKTHSRLGTRELRRTKAELQAVLGTLPDEIVSHLLKERGRKLSLDELEDLVREAGALATPDGLFPSSCPACGAPVDVHQSVGSEIHDPYFYAHYRECDWRK